MMDTKLLKEYIVNLEENQYVDTICNDLDNDLMKSIETGKNQIIGVFSPPGTGKTTMINQRAKRNCDIGIYTVIVSPTILLNDKINSVVEGARNFDGTKFNDATEQIIVTTPEGLKNVVSVLEKNNLYFVLEIDEIHERIDSADTRPYFANIDEAIKNKCCLLSIMYTGTPEVVEKYYTFTKIYRVNKKGKTIRNKPKIINVDSINNKSIKDILEYSYLNFRKDNIGQVFAFINDKKKHQFIENNLDTEIFKNDKDSDILYISANTKNSDIVKEIIKNKKVPKRFRMIIVTSSASTGVEFELDDAATVLVFCNNYTFNIRQEVQATIRVRTNIDNLIFVKPSDKNDSDDNIVNYNSFFVKKMDKYMELLNSKIAFWESIKNNKYIKEHGDLTKERFIKIMNFQNDNENYEIEEFCSKALVYDNTKDTFSIDKALLHKYISEEYASKVLKNTNFFADIMKKHCTHFDLSSEFEILNYNDLFIDNRISEAIQQVLEPLKEDIKDIKQKDKLDNKLVTRDKKNKLKDCESSLDSIVNIILNEGVLPSRSLHKEAYILLDELKNTDSTYKSIEDLLIVTTSKERREKYLEEYLEGATTNKINSYKREEILKNQMPIVYKLVEDDNIKEIKKQPNAVKEKCFILKFYKTGSNKKYPYRKVIVNDKSQYELFKYLQAQGFYKGKELTGGIEKKLLKSVDELFVYESSKNKTKSKSNSKRISSLKY